MLWRLQRSKAGCGPHLTTSSARPNERFLPTLAVLALVVHSFPHCLPHLDVLQRPNLITYLMLRLGGMAAKSSAPQRRVQCPFFRSSCSVPKFSYQYSRTAICIGFLGGKSDESRRVQLIEEANMPQSSLVIVSIQVQRSLQHSLTYQARRCTVV